jgi:hypothetical protein
MRGETIFAALASYLYRGCAGAAGGNSHLEVLRV